LIVTFDPSLIAAFDLTFIMSTTQTPAPRHGNARVSVNDRGKS
jgi:hypothetical protein